MKNSSKNNKKLRIAQIAPLWVAIPSQKYGGIERIVTMLCDGLMVDKYEKNYKKIT